MHAVLLKVCAQPTHLASKMCGLAVPPLYYQKIAYNLVNHQEQMLSIYFHATVVDDLFGSQRILTDGEGSVRLTSLN